MTTEFVTLCKEKTTLFKTALFKTKVIKNSTPFNYLRLPAMVLVSGLLTACYETINSSNSTEPSSGLYDIQVSHKESSIPLASEISLESIGQYSDGTSHDISQDVTIEIADETVLSVTADNKIKGEQIGQSAIFISYGGVSVQLSLSVVEAMCGGAINDPSQQNSANACLKVIKGESGDAKGKLFTSTPSVPFLQMLGYQEDNHEDNQGRSYARSYQIRKNELAGLIYEVSVLGVDFALFRQDGLNWDDDPSSGNFGQNGQFDRYCQDLADIRFSGRADWRRPTETELIDLYHSYQAMGPGGFSLWDNFGFASTYVHWSSTHNPVTTGTFRRFGFYNNSEGGSAPSLPLAASCVSATG